MHGLELMRKVADGSVVEAILGRVNGQHVLVQLGRPALAAHAELLARALAAARSSVVHSELLGPGQLLRTPDGRLAMVSAPVTGWTAADLLRLSGPIAPARVVEWAVVVCEALEAMHASGRVHGCLAPRHLHLDGDSEQPMVRLFDTCLLHLRGSSSLPTTACVVEPEYLSPERASGSRGTVASDIWGMGVLIVELLRGSPPWRGLTPALTREAVQHARPVPSSFKGAWREVLQGCLAPQPVDRFASALELRQAIATLA
jgi:serine/threonine protein kinase